MNTMIENALINDRNLMTMRSTDVETYNLKKLLGNKNLTQSQSIKFGKVFETFLKTLITNKGYELIYTTPLDVDNKGLSTIKGTKELDVCYKHKNIIYYLEVKTNLMLDSEKTKITDGKIINITNYIKDNNVGISVFNGIITCWWEKEPGLPITPKTNVIFMKDFFHKLGFNITKDEYYTLMCEFGKKINNL